MELLIGICVWNIKDWTCIEKQDYILENGKVYYFENILS